ncbi:MAG: hypothetical protein IJ040_08430 [Lachnospiraceae bacterium]|nr:hypothetical protein [Lachnospiraceae bacterium]
MDNIEKIKQIQQISHIQFSNSVAVLSKSIKVRTTNILPKLSKVGEEFLQHSNNIENYIVLEEEALEKQRELAMNQILGDTELERAAQSCLNYSARLTERSEELALMKFLYNFSHSLIQKETKMNPRMVEVIETLSELEAEETEVKL